MATFPHNEQVEIVHKALLLETTLKVGKANIKFLENLSFGDLPPYEQVFPDTPPPITV